MFENQIIDDFIDNGCLVKSKLVSSKDVPGLDDGISESGYVIKQTKIPFIAYPYEWCFSQIKDSAIKTLELLENCLNKDLILKDATAFNLTLNEGEMQFFDILSIEHLKDHPWMAYQQFCQQFLFPLLLTSYKSWIHSF